ncbi:MAG TPA: hypothetical protein VHD15_11055 [Hyphomicrobiales bacterium]|nr:hypothetical protein [Hyphomicrobiales bacterium]
MAESPKSTDQAAAEAAAARTKHDLREGAQDAKDDLAQLRADLARLSETVSTLVANQAHAAKSTVRDTASDLYSKGQEALQQAGEKAKGATDELSHTIEQNPITSVLAAFGIGMLFGLMSRSR